MSHGPNIPGSYAILLFTASDFASITSHIHNFMWLRRSVGAQYATGDQWRNNSRKNEGMEP